MSPDLEARTSAAGRTGKFGVGGLEDLRRFYAPEEMASVHYEWRTLPVTVKMVRALRDIALSHPAMLPGGPRDVAVQYGITLGLALAADLIDDPALVVRGLFGERPPENTRMPDETFAEAPEAE